MPSNYPNPPLTPARRNTSDAGAMARIAVSLIAVLLTGCLSTAQMDAFDARFEELSAALVTAQAEQTDTGRALADLRAQLEQARSAQIVDGGRVADLESQIDAAEEAQATAQTRLRVVEREQETLESAYRLAARRAAGAVVDKVRAGAGAAAEVIDDVAPTVGRIVPVAGSVLGVIGMLLGVLGGRRRE